MRDEFRDELDELLGDLAREEVPTESLRRVAVGVQTRLRRRRMSQLVLAAAAMLAAWYLFLPRPGVAPAEELVLPKAMEAVFPAPDLLLRERGVPVKASSVLPRRPKAVKANAGRAKVLAGDLVQLPSSDPAVVILWDLNSETKESGGL